MTEATRSEGSGAEPRSVLADNPGPFTLDGTRTYIVGRRIPAVVDPGPDVDSHVRAVASRVAEGGAEAVTLLVTHGHRDHAGGTEALARALEGLGMPVVMRGAGVGAEAELADGTRVETDAGVLVAVATPGHAREHLAFHWPGAGAVFVGDLLLGEGDTTWVGEYPGCVADYLASLERLRTLEAERLYPAHGPPIDDPAAALDRYASHRRARIEQVARALAREPDADARRVLALVYGESVPAGLEGAALRSVEALVEHVRR